MKWDGIQYFDAGQFESPDAPGSGENMDREFVVRLDQLRRRLGFPLIVHSGYRTVRHNLEVGGAPDSAHLSGHAADLLAASNERRFRLINEALALGWKRIGIGKNFVHLDLHPDHPQPRMWVY